VFVNVAILKETQAHERRVALVPAVVPKLCKLGAKVHMQAGAGDAVGLPDSAYKDVAFTADRAALVCDADVVLCVQPPALEVVAEMKEGAILVCFIFADHEKRLVHELLEAKKIYVVKRGQGKGYSGVVNGLFYANNCFMVYGDASAVLGKMIEAVKGLGAAAA
jgi:alanine dehydrogenase